MKRKKWILLVFLGPAMLAYAVAFLYPVIRTGFLSFFSMQNITDPMEKWTYVGLDNIRFLMESATFRRSMLNMIGIWFICAVGMYAFATIFAVALTSGMRGKSFWRSAIYMPNVISVVALGTMWVHYVYNAKYGLFTNLFSALGLSGLAAFKWTAPGNLYYGMLIAIIMTSTGYYLLIFMSGIERIPKDYYEVATIEGAGILTQFRKITFPLLRDVYRTALVLWTISCANFFTWPQMFSPSMSDPAVVTPMVYAYHIIFNTDFSNMTRNVGAGAMAAVMLTLYVVLAFGGISLFLRENRSVEL